ncbi:hypothetical protein AVEN_111921-1 [Araneus ventricosus]|uniref:Uncharacterized protein n=1 Tax=Araneus ventricosus TaxID=182803 RepID=A0A4Y2K1X6_ARAVE|nr:hypothetical protein AVEN_111921-1 [Araneus ventricosus]
MEYAKDKYASEAANRQAYSLGTRDSSQRRSTNIVPSRVRSDSSSSSNPRSISDKSCKADDSSDSEKCGSVSIEPMSEEEISMGTNENKSNDRWNEEATGKPEKNNHDIETDAKSHANKLLNSESNETKLDRGLFFNYDDSSISDIEAMSDSNVTKGRVLTSTPNSDIVEQKVLDAAKYDPEEESGLESTLLGQSDIRDFTINTSKNKRDCNFDIYQDTSSVKRQLTDYSEIFGNNYIPPPVPLPISAFRLPPIHRLRSPVPSPHDVSVLRHVSPQKIPQLPTQLRHQLLLPSPSLHLCSRLTPPSPPIRTNSSHMPSVPPYVLSPRHAPPHAPNPLRMSSSIPPTLLPQERFNPTRPHHDASNSLYHLHQRSLNPPSLKSHEQDDSFYIPPPVPPPQQMNGSQQIRNLNQSEDVQSCQPSSASSVNNIVYDGKIWQQDPKTRSECKPRRGNNVYIITLRRHEYPFVVDILDYDNPLKLLIDIVKDA